MAGKKGERAGWRSGAAVIFGVGIWGSPRVRANASHLMPWQAPVPLSRRAGAETGLRSRSHADFPDGHTDSIPHDSSVLGTWQGGGSGPRRPMSVGFGAYRPAQRPILEQFCQLRCPDCDDDVRSRWRPARNARTAGVLANWGLKNHRGFGSATADLRRLLLLPWCCLDGGSTGQRRCFLIGERTSGRSASWHDAFRK